MYRSPYRFSALNIDGTILETVESKVIDYFTNESELDDRLEIPYPIRNQHVYIPGKTRHGKSTLIHAMAYQDIMNGAGVCVIDPKGDLVSSLVQWIPESRKDDCIYLSPKTPVPINFLDYQDDDEKETLVGELKYVVTRGMSAESAPLMDAIITDLIWTLLSARDNPKMPVDLKPTFLDIYNFLSDPDRSKVIRDFVTDPALRKRWDTWPHPKECAPTLTRMTPFIRNPSLRKLFDCPEPELNIADIMDKRKILLVDLGGISESTKIFATLLIAKMKQAAFRRAAIPESKRIPFFLYVDEFKFFQTSDFEEILSFAGGYGLRLTLANQFIGQLDSNIRQSIFGNVGTFILFCLSADDARYFKHIADGVLDANLPHLPKYKAFYSIAGQPRMVKPTPAPPPAPKPDQVARAEYIRNRTLSLYSCKFAPTLHNSMDATKDLPPEPELENDTRQAGSPSDSQPVFRPPQPGRGQTAPRKNPNKK